MQKYSQFVASQIRSPSAALKQGFFSVTSKRGWNISSLQKPENTLCRGITRVELDKMLASGQIPTFTKSTDKDLGQCDYGEQSIQGQGALLSMSNSYLTANMYGANRSFVPSDGAIITVGMPAFYVSISEHVRLCPQLCDDYTKSLMLVPSSPFTDNQSASAPDVVALTIGVDEVAAVVGRHNGVDFGNLLDVNMSVHSILHVFGSGRGMVVDCETCVVENYINPNYAPRALSCEITLTTNPEHLEILAQQMCNNGRMQEGQRLLTPDDAALIMSDEDLHHYLTNPAGPNGPITLTSLPQDMHGHDVVSYLKKQLSTFSNPEPDTPSFGPR
jgi:hypothetical protein|tara:strand:+ start:113149 stop:114141 length:993 start_codon:yes stop_codon:yes gene_type:complete